MHLLCFFSKRLSYDSSVTFMHEMGNVLQKMGAEITWCDLDSLGEDYDLLENYIGQDFDAVLDINSVLPLAMEEKDGKSQPFLDLFEVPFVNIIVDHPLHVHYALQVSLKNYYVVCLDEDHKYYIKEQYPHIKDIFVMSMGGIEVDEDIPYESRSHKLLFPATFTPLSYLKEQMEAVSEHYPIIAEKICDYYEQEQNPKTIDAYFFDLALSDEEMKAFKLYRGRYIDRYVREWYRQNILSSILEEGLQVDVVGFRWELFEHSQKKNLRMFPPCSYRKSLAMMADSKIVLNVQPLFRNGMHDRIENAVVNGAVCFTDYCVQAGEYQKQYGGAEQTGIVFYDRNHPETVALQIKQKSNSLKEMAFLGKKNYKENHVYERKIERFWTFLRKIIS